MKFQIPYEYIAEYIPKGHRKVERAILQADTMVEISEVPMPDMPAYVLGNSMRPGNNNTTYHHWERFRFIDGAPARIWRLEEDGLFAEYCRVDDFVERLSNIVDNPFDASDSAFGSSCTVEDRGQHCGPTEVTTYQKILQGRALRMWKDDLGQAKAALMARRAGSFRIIDGFVCVAVGEPLIAVHEHAYEIDVIIDEEFCTVRHGLMPNEHITFRSRRYRLNQLLTAQSYASSLATATGKSLWMKVAVDTSFLPSEYFPQEACNLNHQAIRTACSLIDAYGPEKYASTKQVVMDALAECPDDHVTPDVVARCSQLLEDVLPYLELPLDPSSDFRPEQSTLRRQIGQLERDFAEWVERPTDPADWFETALPVVRSSELEIEQLLSRFALRKACSKASVPFAALEQEVHKGNAIVLVSSSHVHGRTTDYFFVISPEWQVIDSVGYRGYPPHPSSMRGIEDYLEMNHQRRDELSIFSGLAF